MGAKAKKALIKKQKKTSFSGKKESYDFLPLEGGPGKEIREEEVYVKNTDTVVYIGRIPHGFYEEQMEAFFKQFGAIKRLKIARNKKTGNSKHYGFIEFESPEVAKIVADCMHNYLLFEHMLQVHLVPSDRVHPKLWFGANRQFQPAKTREIERKKHNKERTIEQHRHLVEGILKRDQKRRKRLADAGIDYECPDFVGGIPCAPKKIKFDED
ncbi:Polyadenylate-binding protein RBP47 [Acorus calamus]|uniref:Polyadenylate-binding protein RBP47 n=1 Tax=Acorus calamus TaxID=4465 RepID=A0AAV9D0H3_ACOCL|nr:Polyadenylate-binding protein RBP47 [Acorus calamus]